MPHRPDKIISGGQTGADIGGLVGAERVNIKTGGYAPKGFKTEKGPQTGILKKRFGLIEHNSANYQPRTLENIKAACATLIFSTNAESKGTRLTIQFCNKENKPHLLMNPSSRECENEIIDVINRVKPRILNIAGNRETVSPGISSRVACIIEHVMRMTPISEADTMSDC